MQVNITGNANLSQAKAEFKALQAQVAGLNAAMAQGGAGPRVDPRGYRNLAGAVEAGSKAFRDAAASTGQFRVEQMRLNSATSHYTELLEKQKLSRKDLRQNRGVLRAAYQEQLALHRMTTDNIRKAGTAAAGGGRGMYDVAIPRAFSNEMGTLNQRMEWQGHLLKSAGTQMVNFGKNTQWAGRQLTVGFTMPVVALGVAAGVMAYKVDKEMTRIRKVYDTTADQSNKSKEGMAAVDKEFARLEENAWNTAGQAAKEYGASVSDTLAVQAELAATGRTGMQLQKATTEVMKSAMLGEIDYQTATTATIALQQQLKLSNEELSDSWAYMNSVENATSLQMKDFAKAIPIALGPIRLMGGDLQDLGTLMTSMVSRGVEVGKAANSIKAMPQRLSRPSKQIQEEFRKITGQDILELNKKHGDNIIDLLTAIGDATENLPKVKRRQALAGLFGSYQLAPMEAMIQGMDDLQNGIGQTNRAFEIGEQTTKEWAQVSKQEIKAYQDSASGQFKIMYENLKVELAKMGEPFLEAISIVGKGVTKVLHWFNELPKAGKWFLVFPVLVAAAAGPLLMITGLLYNLVGQGWRAVGSMMAMGKQMVIMTAEEKAMMLAHKAEQAAMQTSIGQTKIRQTQLALLAQSTTHAERTMMAFALAEKGVAANEITAALGREASAMRGLTVSTEQANAAILEQAAAKRQAALTTPALAKKYNAEHMAMVMPLAYEENDRRNAEKSSAILASNTDKTAKNTEKMGRGMKLAAVGTAGMAVSMGAMMLTSNQVVNQGAQLLMMASLIGPMFSGMGPHMKNVALRMKDAAANSRMMSAATGASAKGMRAFAAASLAAMGPVGWIAAGVAAIGFAAYKLWKWDQKRKKDLREQNAALTSQKNLMSDMLDITPKGYKSASIKLGTDVQGAPTAADISEAMAKDKEGKKLVGLYKNAESDATRATIASEKYMQVLRATGGNAKKAERFVTALYMASGDRALEAETKARKLAEVLGNTIEPNEQGGQWGLMMDTIVRDLSETDDIERRAKDIGVKVSDAIATGARGSAGKVLDAFDAQINNQWSNIFNQMNSNLKSEFNKFGINTAGEMKRAMAAFESDDPLPALKAEFDLSSMDDAQEVYKSISDLRMQWGGEIGKIKAIESQVVKVLREDLHLGKEIKTMAQLRATWEFKLLNVNKKNAKQTYLNYMVGRDHHEGMTKADKLRIANQVLMNAGMGKANSYMQAMVMLGMQVPKNFKDSTKEAKSLGQELSGLQRLIKISVDFKKPDIASIRKDAMTGVMSAMADSASETFDNRMNASLDASQRGWDARIEANDNAAQRAAERMDSKWERINARADRRWERRKDNVTSYYDRRIRAIDRLIKADEKRIEAQEKAIKAEEKAEEIRQRIFEAEKTRMERLADMANRNIDFNVAINSGNLDEAAKIRNDAMAQQADWALSDSADASQRESDRRAEEREKRIDALEARQDRLEDRKDKLENQKDRALKQIERNEKAARESLARREKNEKAHMERMQKARAAALKKQADADMASQRRRWEHDKKTLDNRLELFKAYTARNQKDLERWMKKVGLTYDDFGRGVKRRGSNWSEHWRTVYVQKMRLAAKTIQSDKMWAAMGKQSLDKMLASMGFENMSQFRKFVKTGVMPTRKSGGRNQRTSTVRTDTSRDGRRRTGTVTSISPANRHEGGFVGGVGGKNSRKGVARTLRGLHPSEEMIRAQKGEFVVERRAAKENAGILSAINSGKISTQAKSTRASYDSPRLNNSRRNKPRNVGYGTDSSRNVGYGVGGPMRPTTAALAAAFITRGLTAGLTQALTTKYMNVKEQMAAMSGGEFAAGKGGVYGNDGRRFSKQQLKYAAIIASVGSKMGMSKRDIKIGIMTAITESGLALPTQAQSDRDSGGLFQQRPSQGWGTVAQVMDPEYAARKFFSVLRGVGNRNEMSPWMAAQTVQRSAFSNGSNYKQYWDEAKDIFASGLRQTSAGGFAALGGPGGKHRASVPGKGWRNSHDYGNGPGSPIYAIGDGRIISSRDITSGGSSGNGTIAPNGKPYRSYGRVVEMRTKSGVTMLAGHLSKRASVGPVKGGALIGRSGNTGNSSGPHTHFEVNGSINARDAFRRMGIGLNTGGYTTSDGIANLHKDEVVISPERTAALYDGLDKFSSVMDSVKNVGTGTGGEGSTWDNGAFSNLSRMFSVGQQTNSAPIGSPTSTGSSGSPFGNAGSDSGRATTVKTGAYNVLRTTSNAKTIADLKRYMQKVNILALSEWGTTKRKIGGWLEKMGWGLHNAKGSAADTAIAWNKKVYQFLRGGSQALNPHTYGRAGQRNRFAAWAELRDRMTGREFYQISAHTTNKASSHRAIQNEQWRNLAALYHRLKSTGQPVILSGDLNAGVARANQIVKGLKSNFSKGGTQRGTYGRGKIDHIMTGPGIRQKSTQVLGGSSDHNALLGTYYLPGQTPARGGGSAGGSGGYGAISGNAPNYSSKSRRGFARVGSFNVHAYGHSTARSINDLKKVLPRTDAIGLQENTSAAVRAWIMKNGFGMHRGPTGTAIAWRKAKFAASRLGNWDLNKKYRMPNKSSQRYVPYGLLREKETNKRFWMGSAHLIPGEGYYTRRGVNVSKAYRQKILAEQYQRMAMLKDRLDNVAPVVFAGDFNDRRNGMIKGMNTSGAGIDKIYSSLAKAGGPGVISTKLLNSDHPAIFQNYKLPGLATGGFIMNEGLARLHDDEVVVDAARTKILHEGIENLALGGKGEYNLHMHVNGNHFNEDTLADRVLAKWERKENRKPRKVKK